MSEAGAGRSDGRVKKSKEAVLAETYRLLTQEGFNGVSVDEISRCCGVSKATIYRHWPSRSALLLDACSQMGSRPETPDTGSLKGDLSELVKNLVYQLRFSQWAVVLPSIIDAAERDPELAQLHAKLHSDLMAPFLEVEQRARRRGDLPPTARGIDLCDAVIGPLFYRRWFSREPFDDGFIAAVIDGFVASPEDHLDSLKADQS